MKYNSLTVLEAVKHNNRSYFRVQCDCGKVDLKRKDWVESGRTTSCKSCSAKRTAAKHPPPVNRKGFLGLSGTHYLSIKNGAIVRGLSFDLSPEFLWKMYEDQKGLCALTGVPITLVNKIKNNSVDWEQVTASLDRVDSNKPYTETNVQWVHKRINRLKNNFTEDELLYWARLLVNRYGNPEPSQSGDILEGATTRDRDSRVSNISTSALPHSNVGDDIV